MHSRFGSGLALSHVLLMSEKAVLGSGLLAALPSSLPGLDLTITQSLHKHSYHQKQTPREPAFSGRGRQFGSIKGDFA